MKLKIKQILLLAALALILTGVATETQAFTFQTPWPQSPLGTKIQDNPTLAYGIKYAYEWGIGLGGIAVFIVLVMAGFQYITSVGDPGKMKEAFKRIEEAVIGLLILLSSYAILNLVGINLTDLKINVFEQKFANPMTTCTEAETQDAASCCKNKDGSDIAGCNAKYYRCVNGTCQPNLDKSDCSGVIIKFKEAGSTPKPIGDSQLDKQITLSSSVTIDSMKLYSKTLKSGGNSSEIEDYIPCYDPADSTTNKPENPICNCGLQLFTKSLTTSTGGESTNPCQNNTDTQFAADNTTLKSYTQSKTVVCVAFSKLPSVTY